MNYLLLLIMIFSSTVFAQIDIRPAMLHELPQILELDQRITYEFFKPLYATVYEHLQLTNDADADLQKELAADAQSFPEIIAEQGATRLHIAWDTDSDVPCGLLLFSQQDNKEVTLDLLLVAKEYRGKGIGKRLVHSIFQAFTAIPAVNVFPLQYSNDATLKFYHALGFKNLGPDLRDETNVHGIRLSDLYYYFRLDIEK